MLFTEYLHEKAEESRHNETVGYLVILIGSVFLVGGLLVTVTEFDNPQWFLIIPYSLTPHPYSLLSLSLTSLGVTLLVLGAGLGVHYATDRTWYMQELHKAQFMEDQKLKTNKKLEKALERAEEIRKTTEKKNVNPK